MPALQPSTSCSPAFLSSSSAASMDRGCLPKSYRRTPCCFSVWKTNASAWFSTSMRSLASLSASRSLRFLLHARHFFFAEAAGCFDADVLFLAVALSLALTWMMPLASMSNVTSICGTPRGAGGCPPAGTDRWCGCRSPWNVVAARGSPRWVGCQMPCERLGLFVGMVVLASINLVITPPMVSIPKDKGVTSSNNTSFTSPKGHRPGWLRLRLRLRQGSHPSMAPCRSTP